MTYPTEYQRGVNDVYGRTEQGNDNDDANDDVNANASANANDNASADDNDNDQRDEGFTGDEYTDNRSPDAGDTVDGEPADADASGRHAADGDDNAEPGAFGVPVASADTDQDVDDERTGGEVDPSMTAAAGAPPVVGDIPGDLPAGAATDARDEAVVDAEPVDDVEGRPVEGEIVDAVVVSSDDDLGPTGETGEDTGDRMEAGSPTDETDEGYADDSTVTEDSADEDVRDSVAADTGSDRSDTEDTAARGPGDTTMVGADGMAAGGAVVGAADTTLAGADGAAAEGDTSEGMRPGDATGLESPPAEAAASPQLQERWQQAQLGFIDDPRGSTDIARSIASEAIEAHISSLRARQSQLDEWQGRDEPDTEVLRAAIRGYRDLFASLTSED
jgi:hypothetical protein